MRRTRRGGHSGPEFGGSGEDSFVAVVVTKLTGALLFILLMSLVIMALIPKAADLAATRAGEREPTPLEVATEGPLPEAIAGRPYRVDFAARGGRGPLRWALDGELPEGLAFDAERGRIEGTPKAGTPEPRALAVRVSDGTDRATGRASLVVFEPEGALATPAPIRPGLPPVAWRAWLEQGFGFLVLGLVYLVGRGAVGSLERWSAASLPAGADPSAGRAIRRRFRAYRATVALAATGSAAALAAWLLRARPSG
jgi:hypothetical protein